ncbi:copper resistance CopC/CopD family protein [Nitrolancea hollandica]|nr:copper resistance protein CopC [Nitrolancea hollandica]
MNLRLPNCSSRLSPFLIALMLLIFQATLALPVSAHAELVRSEPSAGSLRPDGVRQVDLSFSEAVDPTRSTIEVFNDRRERVDNNDTKVDAADPKHMVVTLKDVVDGIYTVTWTNTSPDDGHTLRGTYTFRVGQSRLPGAAATASGNPSVLAIGLRWASLLGLAAVAGWFLLGMIGTVLSDTGSGLAIGGAIIALVADALLLPAQAFFPPGGLPAEGIGPTLATMPLAWMVRLALEALLLLVVVRAARSRSGDLLAFPGAIIAAAALVSLTFTSHAAANTDLRLPSMAVNSLHILSVAFWVGGVVQLALAGVLRHSTGHDVLKRFSGIALILAPLAVVTGALNAGVTLPAVSSLWETNYGRVLLVKSAIVVAILGVALVNRRRVRQGIDYVSRIVGSLRIEAVLAVVAVLAASILALSVPPTVAQQQVLSLRSMVDDGRYVQLVVNSPDAGRTGVQVWLTDSDKQIITGVDSVSVDFTMLERTIDLPAVRATAQPDGKWTLSDVPLTVKGWWSIGVHFRGPNIAPADARFFVLLPDPTFSQVERGRAENERAREIYKGAIARLTELKSMRSSEELSDGIGNSVATKYAYEAPDKMTYSTTSGFESVAINDVQYFKRPDGNPWAYRSRLSPYIFPANLPSYYSGADEFTLGRQDTVDGERCQVISFHVPEVPGRDESWYVWWVGIDSHLIRQEGMVAVHHYMTNHYFDHDGPIQITVPEGAVPLPK